MPHVKSSQHPMPGFPARWEPTEKVQSPTQHRENFHHSTLLGLCESNVPTEKSALCSISTVFSGNSPWNLHSLLMETQNSFGWEETLKSILLHGQGHLPSPQALQGAWSV